MSSAEAPQEAAETLMSMRRATVSPESREDFYAQCRRPLEEWQLKAISRKRKRPLSTSPSPSPSPSSHLPARPPTPVHRSSHLHPQPELNLKYGGIIRHRHRIDAKKYAIDLSQLPAKSDLISRHIYWTDCSIYLRCAAGAVVWSKPGDPTAWDGIGLPFPHSTSQTELVELFAVAHALEIAVEHISHEKEDAFKRFCQRDTDECEVQPTHHVHIFTDSIGALQRLEEDDTQKHDSRCWDYVRKSIQHYQELEKLGAIVKLHLVPGHSEVPGNVEADRLAYRTARQMSLALAPRPLVAQEFMQTEGLASEIPNVGSIEVARRSYGQLRKSMRLLARGALAARNTGVDPSTEVQTTTEEASAFRV